MTLAQDNIIDIFLLNPCDELFDVIDNKELALKILREKEDSARGLYFLKSKGDRVSRLEIIKEAIKEDNYDIFLDIIESIEDSTGYKDVIFYCARYGRLNMLVYVAHKYYYNFRTATKLVECAAENGHMEVIEYLIDQGFNGLDSIASAAAKGGQRELMEEMIKKGANNYYWIICGAVKGGHKELMEEMIDKVKTVNEVNNIAKYAAEMGHKDIVMDMISGFKNKDGIILKANNYRSIAELSAKYGYLDLVLDMLSGLKNKDGYLQLCVDVVSNAAKNGHINIVKDVDTTYRYDLIARSAAEGGHKEIVDYLLDRIDDDDYREIACRAAEYGHLAIVLSMIALGVKKYNSIACAAVEGGHLTIVDAMIEGFTDKDGNVVRADDEDCIIYSAVCHGRVDILSNFTHFEEIDYLINLASEKGQKEVVKFFFDVKMRMTLNSFKSRC